MIPVDKVVEFSFTEQIQRQWRVYNQINEYHNVRFIQTIFRFCWNTSLSSYPIIPRKITCSRKGFYTQSFKLLKFYSCYNWLVFWSKFL